MSEGSEISSKPKRMSSKRKRLGVGPNITPKTVAKSLQNSEFKDPKKWPPNLHDFISRSFREVSKKKLNANQVQQFKNQLKNIINLAISSDKLFVNDWDKQELPILAGEGYKRISLYCDEEEILKTSLMNTSIDDETKTKIKEQTEAQLYRNNNKKSKNIFGEDESDESMSDGYEPTVVPQSKPKQKQLSLNDTLTRIKKQKKPAKKESQLLKSPSPYIPPSARNKLSTSNVLSSKNGSFEDEQRKAMRSKRFERELSTPVGNRYYDDDTISTGPIVGLNTNLEKKYLRLTSQPKPEAVRPLHILRSTLNLLISRYLEGATYNYLCDQCKSLRQDLTVQNIKDDFTIMAYEFHSKIAIENNDWGEFNQCQSQLSILYETEGLSKPNCYEFLSYRILYFLLTSKYNEIYELQLNLSMNGDEQYKENQFMKYAFSIFDQIEEGNYFELSQIINKLIEDNKTAERELNESADINSIENILKLKHNPFFFFVNFVKSIMDRENIKTLSIICKSYRQISLEYLKNVLCMTSDNGEEHFVGEFDSFIQQHQLGEYLNENKTLLECHKARMVVDALMRKTFSKIDIKGQV